MQRISSDRLEAFAGRIFPKSDRDIRELRGNPKWILLIWFFYGISSWFSPRFFFHSRRQKPSGVWVRLSVILNGWLFPESSFSSRKAFGGRFNENIYFFFKHFHVMSVNIILIHWQRDPSLLLWQTCVAQFCLGYSVQNEISPDGWQNIKLFSC